jgi:hypothetical protein
MFQLFFPRDPFAVRQPDAAYVQEAEAADKLGIPYHLINFEALVEEQDAARAVRQVPVQSEPVIAVYRGWMLRAEQYAALYAALADHGVTLINAPDAYALTHHLPNWYPQLAAWTPRSIWLSVDDALDPATLAPVLTRFKGSPLTVKDYVKSQKHRWEEACFIPNAAALEHVVRVAGKFVELQGPDLNGGIVFRQFETFEPLTQHRLSGMPLTREYRLFFLNGEPISCTPYWEPGEYDDTVAVPLDQIRDAVAIIDSRFFTADVARREVGAWRIVELGDGQVAGLPERADPSTFYRAVLQHIGDGTT